MPAATEERFATVLEKLAGAIVLQSESNAKLAQTFEDMGRNMARMTATIQGAQRKIGNEINPIIDQSKAMNRKLAEEIKRVKAGHADS